jgi:hypothetical protein
MHRTHIILFPLLSSLLLVACGDDLPDAPDATGSSGTASGTGDGGSAPDDDGPAPASDSSAGADDASTGAGSSTGAVADETTATSSSDGGDSTTTTSATGDDDSSTGEPPSPIVGDWTEMFPGGGGLQMHTITEETWTMESRFGTGVFHIEEWQHDVERLVAQNDEANAFFPGLWSKFEWTFLDDSLWYCQSGYDGASLEDAWDTPGANADDLETGCGGFPWSELTPAR